MYYINRKEMLCCAFFPDFSTQFFRNVMVEFTQLNHSALRSRMLNEVSPTHVLAPDENDTLQSVIDNSGPSHILSRVPYLVKERHEICHSSKKI